MITSYTAVQAGLTETVLIERDKESCTIRTLPSQELIELTKVIMEHPHWPEEEEGGKRQEKKGFPCPSCHAPLPPNAKFCRKCGKPVQPQENTS